MVYSADTRAIFLPIINLVKKGTHKKREAQQTGLDWTGHHISIIGSTIKISLRRSTIEVYSKEGPPSKYLI